MVVVLRVSSRTVYCSEVQYSQERGAASSSFLPPSGPKAGTPEKEPRPSVFPARHSHHHRRSNAGQQKQPRVLARPALDCPSDSTDDPLIVMTGRLPPFSRGRGDKGASPFLSAQPFPPPSVPCGGARVVSPEPLHRQLGTRLMYGAEYGLAGTIILRARCAWDKEAVQSSTPRNGNVFS
jgi:hypothetical protein